MMINEKVGVHMRSKARIHSDVFTLDIFLNAKIIKVFWMWSHI